MSDTGKAVFLSYASQDAEAAKRIADALRAAGAEVWFDQSELVGGDAWDAKIRKQIGSCALFVPIISASTQARAEGYFRLEWKLADRRTDLIGKSKAFLLPVCIDDTKDSEADVPDSFLIVQWTRLRPAGYGAQGPRGGEDPGLAKFVARVKKLLSGEVGPVFDRPFEKSAPTEAGHRPALPRKSRRPLVAAISVGAILAAVALWFGLRPVSGLPTPASVASTSAPTAPSSEAGRLIEQAWTIFEKLDNASNDDWVLGEELAEQATKLEPRNPEAWAVYSGVSAMPYIFGLDGTPERLARATKAAQRAISLDPQSVNGRLAAANCYRLIDASMRAEAERVMRTLLVEQPANKRVQRMAGNVFRHALKYDDALAAYDRAMALPGGDPISIFGKERTLRMLGRFAEGEALMDEALASTPGPVARLRKIYHVSVVHDDPARAAQLLAEIPGEFLLREDAVDQISTLLLWQRDADGCIALLRRYGGDTVRRAWKGGLIGLAYRMSGRPEAARLEWQSTLKLIEARLAVQPNDASALYQKTLLMAALGDKAGAGELFKTYEQLRPATTSDDYFNRAGVLTELGRPDEAVAALGRSFEKAENTMLRLEHRADLRRGPFWDPLRSHPGFQALLDKLNRTQIGTAPVPGALPAESTPKSQTPDPGPSNPPQVDSKSVAVLAFANLSDDKANEYFSDGISEELLNVLAKVPGLKVSARTSAFYFKGKEVPIPEIARQLSVAYVVEGSVRKQGDKVRITAQLIKAADGFHVWSDTFTRDLKDIFAVQDEIAGLIARNLELKIGVVAAARTVDPEAYRLYLEALPGIASRTMAGFDRAEQLITQAIAKDPGLVPAQAALAVVWTLRDQQTGALQDLDSPAARRMVAQAEKAVKLGPDSAEAQAACGLAYSVALRLDEATAFLRRAIELNPSYAPAHLWLGRGYLAMGRMDEALAALRRATELDPLSHRALDNYAMALVDAGRPHQAMEPIDRALRIRPESTQAQLTRADVLARVGRLSEALPIAKRLAVDREAGATMFAAEIFALAGERAELEALLLATPAISDLDRWYTLVVLGRIDESLVTLERSQVDWGSVDFMLFNPLVDPLRRHPRFLAKLQAAGLAEAHARAQAWRAANPPETPEGKK